MSEQGVQLPHELQLAPRTAEEARRLAEQARSLVYQTMMELGNAANERGDPHGALGAFEAAHALELSQGAEHRIDGRALLSTANMHLKLGNTSLARELYAWLLRAPRLELAPAAVQMCARKLRAIADAEPFDGAFQA